MKRKFAIFNLVLMAVVLFTTSLRSFHSFSHGGHSHSHRLEKAPKQFSAAGHEHSHEDDCSVCDFHFDFFVAPQEFCLRLDFLFKPVPYTFSSIEGDAFFAGSLFALRAPPVTV